ncbi:helix-turn-helix domain-containing protein, partial [Vibrio sp. 2132-1]|uniref:helix-turn-helix domain-containing protein n=1 Tax=Vibrio sp. 2132-1 TaxID=3074598 RepID=UPI0029668AFF
VKTPPCRGNNPSSYLGDNDPQISYIYDTYASKSYQYDPHLQDINTGGGVFAHVVCIFKAQSGTYTRYINKSHATLRYMMSKEAQEIKPQELSKRWGKEVINEGWTAIPNTLIERQQALKLNPTEMNILLVLLKYWWEDNKSPFPSKKTIADYINRDISTVRKTKKKPRRQRADKA